MPMPSMVFAILCLAVGNVAGKDPGIIPEPLMNVTLECDEGWLMHVLPLASVGVDIVNFRGKSPDDGPLLQRIRLEYLPGAVVCLRFDEREGVPSQPWLSEAFLSLTARDNGKTIRLRPAGAVIYKDNAVAWVNFETAAWGGTGDPKIAEARQQESRQKNQRTLEQLQRLLQDKQIPPTCNAGIGLDAEALAVFDHFPGSEMGLFLLQSDLDVQSAIRAVQPKKLAIVSTSLAELTNDLGKIETLLIVIDKESSVAALPPMPMLRHLVLVNGADSEVDLKCLSAVPELQALTLYGNHFENISSVGLLKQLRFLTNMTGVPVDHAELARLTNLQYLYSTFPAGSDMSFVNSMPFLQTLALSGPVTKLDLTPLKFRRKLKCVALDPQNAQFDQAVLSANVKSLRNSRPDIRIVPYEGVCLGSGWLIPVAVGAALAAWLVRLRWRRAWKGASSRA